MAHLDRITIEPGKRSGKPCIRGLRMTVSDVLDYLASGMSGDTSVPHFQDHASDNWEPEGAGSDGVVNRSWSDRRSNMLSWSTCSIW